MFNKSKKSLIALLAAIFAAALLCVGVSLLSPKAQKAYASSGVSDVVQVTINSGTPQSYATFNAAITDIDNISNGNVEIKLLGNAMATKELSSGNNAKYFTLDLNGYALTVNSPVKCARLTLKDSMAGTTDSAYLHEISDPTTADTTDTVQIYGGVLTNPSGRALTVGSTYEVAMESGTIAGCADSGVYVDRGDFTMTGGTISYNTATYGGGVYIQEGDFTMTGGTISYNTTTEKNGGGGVCVASSTTFNISGAPKIKDNKRSTDDHAKDVSSYNDAINVNGALTVGAEIYIDWTVKITGYTQSEKPSQYFKSDDPTKCAQAGVNGDVALSAHTGGTATCKAKAVCTHCGESYGELGGHSYGAPSYAWAADNSTCTAEHACTTDGCTAKETETVSAASQTTEPTCTEGGYDTLTATFENTGFSTQTKQVNETAAAGHSYGADHLCIRCRAEQIIYWGVSENGATLTISGDAGDITNVDSGSGKSGQFTFNQKFEKYDATPWTECLYHINTVKILNGVAPVYMNYWFYNFSELENTDFSGLDTSNVIEMKYTFANCVKLGSVDLHGFSTSKVVSTEYMFSACYSLEKLDLSLFDVSEVKYMNNMFNRCTALKEVVFSENFNAVKATTMKEIFVSCEKLTSLDLSSFHTRDLECMTGMFSGCGSLVSVKFPESFDTSNVLYMNNVFTNCKALTEIDLTAFNTAKVTTMENMFNTCEALNNIKFPATVDASNVTTMKFMFSHCKALTKLNLSSFNTANVTVIEGMFFNCAALTSLDLSSFNISNVTNKSYLLYGCAALNEIKTPAIMGNEELPLPDSTTDWGDGSGLFKNAVAVTNAGKTIKKHVECVGGTATCQTKATCEICGQEYGELGAHSLTAVAQKNATCTEAGVLAHDHCGVCGKDFIENVEKSAEQLAIAKTAHSHITHHEEVDATTDNAGNYEYWSCEDCDTYFSDSEGTTEIDKASVVIPKITVTPAEKKSYLWLLWLLIPLALAAGGVTYGIYLYKKKKRM